MACALRFFVSLSEIEKTAKKTRVKATPETVATCFVKRLITHKREQRKRDQAHADGDFNAADFQIKRYAKFPPPGFL